MIFFTSKFQKVEDPKTIVSHCIASALMTPNKGSSYTLFSFAGHDGKIAKNVINFDLSSRNSRAIVVSAPYSAKSDN